MRFERNRCSTRGALMGLAAAVYCPFAQAQQAPAHDEHRTLSYVQPPPPNRLRSTLEELAVLVAGVGYYYVQRDVNSLDWTYDYEWSTLEAKLTGNGYSFDTNYFKTNTLAHSGAGALYYIAARGNRLPVAESIGAAFVGSAAWELLAEFRERVSINDVFITPFGGFAFGEAMTQVGALFDRGCDTPLFRTLGSVFGPSRSLHDWLDGAHVLRSSECDINGFSTEGWHSIRINVGTALAAGGASGDGRNWLEGQAQIDVIHLQPHAEKTSGWESFTDGNVARLGARMRGATNNLQDLRLQARSIPFGVHRYIQSDAATRELVLGVGAGLVYSQHRYAAEGKRDPLFVLELPALYGQWRWTRPSHQWHVGFVAASTLSEVGVFALQQYAQNEDLDALTPIAASRGYNHALGITLNPEVGWSSPWLAVDLSLRVDRMFPILKLIGDKLAHSDVPVSEARRQVHISAAVGEDPRIRFRTDFDWEHRSGSVGEYTRHVSDVTWTNGIEARF